MHLEQTEHANWSSVSMCPLAVRRRRPLPAKQRQGLKSRRHKKAPFAHPCATLIWFCCTSLFAQDMQVSLCFSASGSAQALFANVQLLSASDFLSANSLCEFVCAPPKSRKDKDPIDNTCSEHNRLGDYWSFSGCHPRNFPRWLPLLQHPTT